MAALRPVVKVTQLLANPSVTASIPDLTCLIVGPAYHIRDYATDKADIQTATDYGVRNDPCLAGGLPANLPAALSDAITIAAPIDNEVGAILDSDSVVIWLDDVLVNIENRGDGVRTEGSPIFTSATANFVTAGVKLGDRVVITDLTAPACTIKRVVYSVTDANTLVFYSDVNEVGTDINGDAYTDMALTGLEFRVERELDDVILDPSFVEIDGQQVIVLGGATADSEGPPVLTDAVVNYAKVYMQYRSLRQDLAVVNEVETTADITATLGRIDERNPLAVGAFVALQNTSSAIKVYGILSDNLNGSDVDRLAAYTTAIDAIESRKDIYCIVHLATETAITTLFKNHVVALADPEISNFRIAIGSSVLPTTAIVSVAGTGADELDTTGNIVVFVDPARDFVVGGVLPGASLVISNDGGPTALDGTYEVRRVLGPTILEMVEGDVFAGLAAGETADYTLTGMAPAVAATVTTRRRIYRLIDNDATFITDGVQVGDFIEIPVDGGNDFTTALNEFTVSAILSDNRLEVDLSDGEGDIELPSLTGGTTVDTVIDYRVSKTLDKADQVIELNAVTDSLKNSRLVMMWPDACKVSGVENAYTGVQNDSPGYYLGCALGGMISGFPSHQNFTNLAMGGIDSVSNSGAYFTVAQIDALSNGGWNVILQDTATSAPYSVHALTTDTTTLESGEIMFVKNFDFVSTFFKNILVQFLDGYNVLPETLSLIETAFTSGAGQLKSKRYAKIGSPLLDATIEQMSVTEGSADQVEIFATVTLPRPLNRIALFLTA